MIKDFMSVAYSEAKKAYNIGEVPVGAVIVKDGKIIARAYNKREKNRCSLDHAEVLAIKKACKKLNDWRLENCEIFVTLEPCPMCIGAILNARIKKLYYGASDKTSPNNLIEIIASDIRLNHNVEIIKGIEEKKCGEIISKFFKEKRKSNYLFK